MARTTVVVLTCDLHNDSTEAVTTLKLESNGSTRELDVCQTHFDELMDSARRPTRRASAKKRSAKGPKPKRARVDLPVIREWARANGYTVADRGRLSADIVAAFQTSKKKR
jgi:hypothetical protein